MSKLTGIPPFLVDEMLTSQGGANIATLHSEFNTV